MSKSVDAVILGGGIAGLWTLGVLRAQGRNAILVETRALGEGQTIASQGIIHGGLKYNLSGEETDAFQAIREMPKKWEEALQGKGDVSLAGAKRSASGQYLFSLNTLASRVGTYFAAQLMRSSSKAASSDERPAILKDAKNVFYLPETILDMSSVLRSFLTHYSDALLFPDRFTIEADTITLQKGEVQERVRFGSLLVTAGLGSHSLAQEFASEVEIQKRPLHMVCVKGQLPELYAHCVGAKKTPLLTLTSHSFGRERVWYLGGELAESGVGRSEQEQLEETDKLLKRCFPSLALRKVKAFSFQIDRVEAKTKSGQRPLNAAWLTKGKFSFGFPSKLTLAPELARQALDLVGREYSSACRFAASFHQGTVAYPPWEKSQDWKEMEKWNDERTSFVQ